MTAEAFIVAEIEKFLQKHDIKNKKVILSKPKQKQFGDFSCNIAMQLASDFKKNPRQIAQDIIATISLDKRYINKIELAGPGFINFFVASENIYQRLNKIIEIGPEFGKSDIGNNKKAQVEFISANPTGPLTIGHGRQAVLGDTISRLLETIGYEVTREYYFNNAGRQIRILGESVRLRYLALLGEEIEFPDDYYQGNYINDIAMQIYQDKGDTLRDVTAVDYFKAKAEEEVFNDIKSSIKNLGFAMDVFFNEKSLYDEGKIDQVVNLLKRKKLIYEKDGAVWFATSRLGIDQDRVIIKSSGEPTYRLPDIAYHREKFERGFDLIIDIFGADHIATYPDVLNAIKALDYDTSRVKVLIHQFVTLTEGGKVVKMSTRKANFVTLDELIEEVGADVTRFFFLMRHMNSHLNFDLELARKHSDENPVFYVQYAHARICSIIHFGDSKGINFRGSAALSLLVKEEEKDLIKHLLQFPGTIEKCAIEFEPHKLANYMIDTASRFHKFYTECRVISEDMELTQARLTLCEATRIVLSNGCAILGIAAPEKM